jgi:hypothetical protein
MKTYSEFLAAGVPLQLQIGGKVLYVQRSEAGQVLNVEFINGRDVQSVERVGKGFKATPAGGFGSIRITATESGTVDFVVTDGEIDVKFDDAATVIGNDDSQAVPVRLPAGQRLLVDVAGGNVQVTATAVGINNGADNPIPMVQPAGKSFVMEPKADAEFKMRAYLAATVADADPVQVTEARTKVIDASVRRRGLRLRNTGVNPVAMGGATVTLANAVVVIQPGETWNENEAPGAAWYCITAAGLASFINLQSIE